MSKFHPFQYIRYVIYEYMPRDISEFEIKKESKSNNKAKKAQDIFS